MNARTAAANLALSSILNTGGEAVRRLTTLLWTLIDSENARYSS